jgi:L-amino acid N-acyltransferase YncA
MNELLSIKKASSSDAYDIALINAVSWQKAYRGIVPDPIIDNISVEQWASGWRNQLDNNENVLLIHKTNQIIGFAHLCKHNLLNSFRAELNSIYLHPTVWGNGYGKKLYFASLIELQRLGYKVIFVWVLAQNIRARKFYEAMGLQETGSSRHCNLFPRLQLNELQYENKICLDHADNSIFIKTKDGNP